MMASICSGEEPVFAELVNNSKLYCYWIQREIINFHGYLVKDTTLIGMLLDINFSDIHEATATFYNILIPFLDVLLAFMTLMPARS
uniref:Transmembrane protein n=1 Tax=Steinernema glaseri TaxID=37863 RepID=A0A1I7YAI6_9BILA